MVLTAMLAMGAFNAATTAYGFYRTSQGLKSENKGLLSAIGPALGTMAGVAGVAGLAALAAAAFIATGSMAELAFVGAGFATLASTVLATASLGFQAGGLAQRNLLSTQP